MPVSARPERASTRRGPGSSRAAASTRLPGSALLGLLLVLLCIDTRAVGFVVHSVSVRVVDQVYLLDASVDLDLSDAAIEALRSGVGLTVALETQVVRKRRWMWDRSVADVEARFAIEYHALSNQYVLHDLGLDLTRSYGRLDPLIENLGEVRDFPLLGTALLEPSGDYAVRVRMRLDIESLPAPMRPLAYVSSLWRLDSEWYEWPLSP